MNMKILKIDGGVLYQWDTGRFVEIGQYNGCTVSEIHFKNPGGSTAYIVEPIIKDGRTLAPIPNILLQDTANITVFASLRTAGGERTICDRTFGITPRQKPSDYVYTETEVVTWEEILQRCDTVIKEVSATMTDIENKVDAGDFNGKDGAKGEPGDDGYTPIRGVDYWTEEDVAEIHQYIDDKLNPVEEQLVMINEGGVE